MSGLAVYYAIYSVIDIINLGMNLARKRWMVDNTVSTPVKFICRKLCGLFKTCTASRYIIFHSFGYYAIMAMAKHIFAKDISVCGYCNNYLL